MVKKTMLFVLAGMCLWLVSPAFAEHGSKQCSMGDKECKMGGGHEKSQCPIAGQLMTEAHGILEHKTDLALTDEQIKSIKDLKLESKKDSTRQEADMKIFMLDLQSKLRDEKLDVDGTNALIDQNFAAFSSATKANVAAYAKLKAVLTPEQSAKLKNLWKEEKHQEHKHKS